MKKFMAMVTCLILVLSFAACGKKAESTETTTAAEKTTVAEETTVVETTTTLTNVETRFSHKKIKSMIVWEKGKKVNYKADATKVMTATAALNDSVVNDDFIKSDKKANFDDVKKKTSCVEINFKDDQTAKFTDEKIVYDQVIVPTTGDYVNIIFFLKDGAVVGAIEAVKGEASEKTVSENVSSAVVVVKAEKHTHK